MGFYNNTLLKVITWCVCVATTKFTNHFVAKLSEAPFILFLLTDFTEEVIIQVS